MPLVVGVERKRTLIAKNRKCYDNRKIARAAQKMYFSLSRDIGVIYIGSPMVCDVI